MPVLKTFKNGIWEPLGGSSGSGGSSINVTAEVGQTIIVEEVDENGKPTKWKAADYQPRTHWSEEGQDDIVPELTFTPILDENMGIYTHPLARFEFEEGKTYTVIFDGVSYTCTAFSGALSNTQSLLGIGNAALAGGANTGEPFGVTVLSNHTDSTVLSKHYVVVSFDNNEHTIRIIENKIVPHKIPDEYVTSSNFPVNIAVKDYSDPLNNMVLLTPWEDIIDAVKTEKSLYLRIEKDDYEFDEYGNPHTFYCVDSLVCTDAKVGINTLKCTLKFKNLSNSDFQYVVVERDKNGVTTISYSY